MDTVMQIQTDILHGLNPFWKFRDYIRLYGYQVTNRAKAKEVHFASWERTDAVYQGYTLRIVGNGTQKWDAKGTYGVHLLEILVSLASFVMVCIERCK